MSFSAGDFERRLANLLRIGTIVAVDLDAARARVRIGGNLTAPLPWLTARAGGDRTWWPVEVGEQVMVLAPSGDLTQGVILPALYSTAAPAPSSDGGVDRREYTDGAVIEYDRTAHTLTADVPGDAVVKAAGVVTATGGDSITLTAPVITLDGDLIRLAGPIAAVGLDGTAYTATFTGDLVQVQGSFTNEDGDVTARGVSLHDHTHHENGEGGETDPPTA